MVMMHEGASGGGKSELLQDVPAIPRAACCLHQYRDR